VKLLVEKLKNYLQVSQILLFVVYERSLKLDCNQNFELNTNFTETLPLKTGLIILQTPVYQYFLLSMLELVRCFLWENCEAELSYCTD